MDIKRAPPSKKRKYIALGTALATTLVVSLGISQLDPAVPSVDRATLWVESVRHGELLREVRAPGTLMPEHLRIVAAVTAGRIEQIPVRPGIAVVPNTLLIEMSNTDVQLQALQAEQSLTQARSSLASLRTMLRQQRLAQEGAIAQIATLVEDAKRQSKVLEALDAQRLSANTEVAAARDRLKELETRAAIERARHEDMVSSEREQVKLTEEQVQRLGEIVREQMNRVRSMRIVAGEGGQLLSLGAFGQRLELGQWVNPGMELARIARPGRLKAVLRVGETLARDVAVGQRAAVDTRNGIISGHVMRIEPGSQQGAVTVEIALDGEMPRGARADMSVDGTIEIERLTSVLYVGRPARDAPGGTVGIFRLSANGSEATRVNVKLGRASANSIEVLHGLAAGDSIIISDMSQWATAARVKVKR
jgi:HlyD family secretion protein